MNDTGNDENSHYAGAILETILDTVTALAEGQTSLWHKVNAMHDRLQKVEEASTLMPAIMSALKDQSRVMNSLDLRMKQLEQRIA